MHLPRSFRLMLRETLGSIASLGPFLGLGFCDHSPRAAEWILLAIVCGTLGCCFGSLITALILFPRIRTILAKLLLFILEGDIAGGGRDWVGQDRLQRYRV